MNNIFNIVEVKTVVSRNFDKEIQHHIYTGIKNENGFFFYPGEIHDYWEVVYVEKGRLTVAEDEKINSNCYRCRRKRYGIYQNYARYGR